jgi:hypothetical protein
VNHLEKTLSEALCEANQEIERLKAIIAEREWQPIETAPSGVILLYYPPVLPTARYRALPEIFRVVDNRRKGRRCMDGATHWQPLPKPPETGK